jgi:Flp pilus assembly protein TadB
MEETKTEITLDFLALVLLGITCYYLLGYGLLMPAIACFIAAWLCFFIKVQLQAGRKRRLEESKEELLDQL